MEFGISCPARPDAWKDVVVAEDHGFSMHGAWTDGSSWGKVIPLLKEMAKHVPDAGSYAPVTLLVDERPDGVRLSYDRMASLLAAYGNPDALQIAKHLDNTVETLLREAAA